MSPLDALAARARLEMSLFEYPNRDWLEPRHVAGGSHVYDVAIVGGGHSGIGIALGLMRSRVPNFIVLDENDPEQEGPWNTYARMLTLRTLKVLTGPDFGIPSLTYRAWYEAQFGPEAWIDLVRIPRTSWMRYLIWLREVLRLPFWNRTRLVGIDFRNDLLRLTLRTARCEQTMWTRKLVLATGLSGAGGPFVPAMIRDNLPRHRWSHTSERIDFNALLNKRVAVLGAGSAAFDTAATALEAGAGQVDLFMRRAALPVVNALRVVESAAFFRHFAELPDDVRWRFMRRMTAASVPPPRDTVERASRHANFNLRVATPWNSVTMTNAGIRIGTPRGVFEVDHVIAGTGFEVDLRLRPELTGIADHIALWSDRYTPPREEQDATLARYPYIGQCYQLLPRDPHAANWVSRIHLFNAGALVSTGSAAGGINSLPWRLPRLVNGITRDLFIAEADRIYEELASYDEPDPWEALSARAEAAP